MCLIGFAIGASARWPLVVAANRDEYLDRPSAGLARWHNPAGAEIISGRDLRAGGTWFGVTPQGRVAFLTNVRERPERPGLRSRGELVTRWLESTAGADSFVAGLRADDQAGFAGFNLVIGDFAKHSWHWVTNRGGPAAAQSGLQVQALAAGVYGLSNAALDTPWPKTTRIKAALVAALQTSGGRPDRLVLEAAMWAALADSKRASATLLPATGVSLLREQALSSAFVDVDDGLYGTVNSTLLTVASPGESGVRHQACQVSMQERQHLRQPGSVPAWTLRSERLVWPAPSASA